MLESRRVVGHAICASWYEEAVVAVAVLALVHAGVVAKMGGRSVAGDSAFVHPGHGGGVVRAVGQGGIGDVTVACYDVKLA